MKLAVMQPYLFPYIGYFQLIQASDLFILYDDVAYIKQGYINRNTLLTSNGTTRFTVPVPGASSNKLISELKFSTDVNKVLKTIKQSYSKAPYFEMVFPLVRRVLEYGDRSIASLCLESYRSIFSYLNLENQFLKASDLHYDRSKSAKDRLIDLCDKFDADYYINASGGKSLYSKSDFSEQGITLKFIDSISDEYRQISEEFVPNLSIIDVLMNCSPEEVTKLIGQYELN